MTGSATTNIDVTAYLGDRMSVFFAAVLGVSSLALLVVFRSLLVPLKAVVVNVASIAAAYGVVVAVFQWWWGASALGFEGGPINPFTPLMLFAIVFGLSTDYEVFLLSRMCEAYDRTGDAVTSVADGLASTARVITAAAIMVVVFGSFVFEDIREVKLFGLGLALAVMIAATLVRMVVVPATMELLGHRNWWLPDWLDRLLPRVEVEGGQRPTPVLNALLPLTSLGATGTDASMVVSWRRGDVTTPGLEGRRRPRGAPGRPLRRRVRPTRRVGHPLPAPGGLRGSVPSSGPPSSPRWRAAPVERRSSSTWLPRNPAAGLPARAHRHPSRHGCWSTSITCSPT